MSETQPLEKKLERAKVKMLLRMAYFGNFMLGIPIKIVDDPKIPTACTNMKWIKINRKFGDTLSRDELIFVGGHETLHIAFKHGLRRGHRDPQLFNIACDIPINWILLDSKIGTMPETVKTGFWDKCDPEKYKGMGAETIYDLMEKERKKQGGKRKFRMGRLVIDLDAPGGGVPGAGDFEDPTNEKGEGLTEAEAQAVEQAIDGLSAASAQAAKSQGTLPADIERMVYELLKPKIDWKERLKKFVGRTIPSDMTWRRPARCGIGIGLYLPSMKKTGCGKIVVCIDTSGSIGSEELGQFWAEVTAIFEDANPESLEVLYCDAAVAGHDSFAFGEPIVCKPRGGGGTDFRPPFEYVRKNDIRPQCFIYLSDLYGSFPEHPPEYPVLWVSTTEVVAPHGETVKLDL